MTEKRRSWLGTLMAFFPALVLSLSLGAFYALLVSPSPLTFLAVAFVLYLFPLLSYRWHQAIWPLKEGVSTLVGADYSPWYGAHQIQLIYIALPGLETALRLIPGLFSLWLRLWGSEVGRAVHWTPTVEILDRGLLTIGDRAVFGHRCGLSSHIITPREGNLSLLVARVRIGRASFVGAGCYIGPGVIVDDGATVPAGHNVRPKQRVSLADVQA